MTARAVALVALVALSMAGSARAEQRTYLVALGNNALPAAGDEDLRPLRYADDDAAAVYRLGEELGMAGTLLAVLDADTQRRFPELARVARPPTLPELRRVVAQHARRFAADVAAGHEPVLLLFYSGHGSLGGDRAASLALLDGSLTQAVLYEEVLARLPARYVHLLVDACHAEAVVRPRDAQAPVVEVSEADARTYAAKSTLARFPHVGAVIATTSSAQAHEWDVYQRGVFTHQLVSGLRGAADVNGDGAVEYSELGAFLSAANRSVTDARARLAVVARPPALDRRARLVDLGAARRPARLRIGGPAAAALGRFHVEDGRGNRVADVHAEPGFGVALAVPAGETLYVRARGGEVELRIPAGQTLALAEVALQPASTRTRGALDVAMRRGLFAVPFGPAYYAGFVDRSDELIPVPLAPPPSDALAVAPAPRPRGPWIALGAAGSLAAASLTFAVLAAEARDDYEAASTQRAATEARGRFGLHRGLAIASAIGGGVAAGIGGWLLWRAGGQATARILPGPGEAGLGVALAW